MTKNRRYEAHYDALNDERIAHSAVRSGPCTLPQQAYGPRPLEWVGRGEQKPPVWAWISWPDRPADRIQAFAAGWNDRVVIVEWYGRGGIVDTVVWRNAVSRRGHPTAG